MTGSQILDATAALENIGPARRLYDGRVRVPMLIRPAKAADLDAINAIYNHYVHHSTCTYQEEPSTADERAAWFTAHGPDHPVTVAESNGEVVGWGSLSRYHARSAYRRTVENSVYVRHDLHRRGIGASLLVDLIDRAAGLGHHTIIAGIDTEQTASVAIHRRFGFEHVGHLREVGFKFGRWLDVIYMQRMLEGKAGSWDASDRSRGPLTSGRR